MSALVNYSSSSDDDDQDDKDNGPSAVIAGPDCSKQLPSLPTDFRHLYTTNVRVSNVDDPNLHEGRQRQTPHVEGNWPSHIFIDCKSCSDAGGAQQNLKIITGHPTHTESQIIQNLIDKVATSWPVSNQNTNTRWNSSLSNDNGVSLPLHISLSQTLQIPKDDRPQLLQEITSAIKCLGIKAFILKPAELKLVSNQTKTRTFLVIRVCSPENDELNRILEACNRVVAAHGYTPLYTGTAASKNLDVSDCFHLSIAWVLGHDSLSPELQSHLNKTWNTHAGHICQKIEVPVNTICFKIGNVVHAIGLGFQDSQRSIKKRRLA